METSKHPDNSLDEHIKDAVLSALLWSWSISKENISIEVKNGWVVLEGELQHQYQIKAAESIVANVKGVKCLISRLRLIQ